MKKMLAVVMAVAIVLGGCAKKTVEAPGADQAHQLVSQGVELLKQAEVAKAIQMFAGAIKVAPDYFEGYYLLSETLIRLKQYPQAEAILLAAVKRFPDSGVAYYLLAVAHQNAGNAIPAIVAARKSVEILNAKGDKEGQQRATILLAALMTEAKKLSDAKAAERAKADAHQAAEEARAVVAGAAPAVNAAAAEPKP